MLITKRVHCPDFIPITDRKLRFWLIVRFKMGILNAVFGFKAYPFDIMLLSHRVFRFANGYMDGIPLQLVYRDMLFYGGSRCAWHQLLHFLTATIDRNAIIPNQGYDITAVLTNQKFLFHFISLPTKSMSQ